MLGTVTTILVLMRRGGVDRPGRAMLLAGISGSLSLSLLFFELPEWLFYFVIYLWGLGGGISMTMSRSIVQEASPETHRARLMSVYSLGMMGGMPIGSLALGWCVGQFGVRNAVLVPVIGFALVVMFLGSSKLWQVRRMSGEIGAEPEPVT
jgi:MFS family permease